MNLILKIYKDETLTEVEREAQADRLKIPYRVATYVAQSLDTIGSMNNTEVFDFVINNLDKVDKIIKATFGVTDTELERVDLMELGDVATEIYKWAVEKFESLKNGKKSKNLQETV